MLQLKILTFRNEICWNFRYSNLYLKCFIVYSFYYYFFFFLRCRINCFKILNSNNNYNNKNHWKLCRKKKTATIICASTTVRVRSCNKFHCRLDCTDQTAKYIVAWNITNYLFTCVSLWAHTVCMMSYTVAINASLFHVNKSPSAVNPNIHRSMITMCWENERFERTRAS